MDTVCRATQSTAMRISNDVSRKVRVVRRRMGVPQAVDVEPSEDTVSLYGYEGQRPRSLAPVDNCIREAGSMLRPPFGPSSIGRSDPTCRSISIPMTFRLIRP
jgi:hypothetical protein